MTDTRIVPIVMPKWGLEMREGTVTAWLVEEGAEIAVGTPIVDVETDKISNAVEAPDPGLLRRQVAKAGETLPVKALLGALADTTVSDAEIDAFVAGYVVPAAGTEEEEGGSAYQTLEVDGLRIRTARRGPSTGVPSATAACRAAASAAVSPVIARDTDAGSSSCSAASNASFQGAAGEMPRAANSAASDSSLRAERRRASVRASEAATVSGACRSAPFG